MTNWVFEKTLLEEPRGPKGGKRKRNYKIWTGTKAEWEARVVHKLKIHGRQRVSFDELLEIFPDEFHRKKWRDLPPPDRGTRHGRPPEFWRSVTWHTRCLPMLNRFFLIIPKHMLREPIELDWLIENYQKHWPKYGRNYIYATLNQLWKGGAIRKFVRYHLFNQRPNGRPLPKTTGGRYYGVHYAFYPYSEEEIRVD